MGNLLNRNILISGAAVGLNGVAAAGWDGSIPDSTSFYVVDSNVGVNKVDAWMERKINYKLLDLHLLKSKTLIDNFSCFLITFFIPVRI